MERDGRHVMGGSFVVECERREKNVDAGKYRGTRAEAHSDRR